MGKPTYYSDFRLGTKKLSDFGGIIYNAGENVINLLPNMTHITESMNSIDGEIYYGAKYEPRTIEVPCYFEGDVDLDELKSWLCSKEEQDFNYIGDDKKISVVYASQLDMTAYYNNPFQGTMTITFIAYNPFWKPINDDLFSLFFMNTNSSVILTGGGNVKNKPLIEVRPKYNNQAKIRLKFGDYIIVLQNLVKPIFIDCENEEVYELQAGTRVTAMNKFYTTDFYDFPYLEPNKQTEIKLLEGAVDRVLVTRNARWI